MTLRLPLLAAAAAALFAVNAEAATIYATGVTWTNNGTVGSANNRNNPLNALGAPDGKFLAIGLLGTADFTFGQTFTGPGVTYEITFGNRAGYPESANVLAGRNGQFVQVGTVNNQSGAGSVFQFTGVFDTLRLVDTSGRPSTDGFDVDAVGVSAVPLPAAGLLLAGALGGLGLSRRKRREV